MEGKLRASANPALAAELDPTDAAEWADRTLAAAPDDDQLDEGDGGDDGEAAAFAAASAASSSAAAVRMGAKEPSLSSSRAVSSSPSSRVAMVSSTVRSCGSGEGQVRVRSGQVR